MLTKQIIDEHFCGMEIFEKYGWFTNAIAPLELAVRFGQVDVVKDIIQSNSKHVKVYTKTDKIFEDDGDTYLPEVVWQIELEIAYNWLGWNTHGEMNHVLATAWEKLHNKNLQCYKNEDFSHVHFRMTD